MFKEFYTILHDKNQKKSKQTSMFHVVKQHKTLIYLFSALHKGTLGVIT